MEKFFELHDEKIIGYKALTDADLGRSITSHQTHIGLFDDVLTIFIHAPFESRVRRVKEDYQEEHDDYKKIVMKKDKARSNYYNYYTTKKWGQLKNFDLTINGDFGIEEVADIIVALYQKGEHNQK